MGRRDLVHQHLLDRILGAHTLRCLDRQAEGACFPNQQEPIQAGLSCQRIRRGVNSFCDVPHIDGHSVSGRQPHLRATPDLEFEQAARVRTAHTIRNGFLGISLRQELCCLELGRA